MSMILMIFFMIPILFYTNWWLFMCLILIIFLINFVFSNYYPFLINLSYSLGVDVVSINLINLTIWIIFLMIMASFLVFNKMNYPGEFLLICLFLLMFLYLSFCSSNLFMFYIFFECSLIPTLFLIFGWGYQPERLSAGFYLLFYTLFASLPLLLGIFYINKTSYTSFMYLININSSFYLYLSMILAFLIKMPMVFFHFWLPSAHVEAPVSGSMILAGVLLKLGGYGLIRVYLFLNCIGSKYNFIWLILSLFGMVVTSFICLAQTDIKSMIAYSSVGHMGMVICGIMTLNYWGFYGALILMISHGLCSSGLFALANILYERTHSRSFYINKGMITIMPSLSFLWFLLSANNMACPPSLNLLGEIMLFNSIISWCSLSFMFLGLASFLSCCYSIYLYCITQHGMIYSGMNKLFYGNVREFMLILFHWIPLNLMILKVDILVLWI
uniref:NADH dehydrogenase subunit 4 n=1 Tax=Sigara lateralis TaxID=537456 RepID=UPI00286BA483|nr:NADH dehydrogenase subunit 4 [Sigara lateralis]WKD80508.1 NADH dehydrogenase subunit 4 [Sigara lateralis]